MSATLTSAGVGAAAGALIAFSFTMSPPLTVVPPRPSDANGNPSFHQNTGGGVASTHAFDRRWHVGIHCIPPMPAPKGEEPPDLPFSNNQPALEVASSQEPQVGQDDFASAAKPSGERALALVAPKPPTRPSDVCARNGLRRIEYTQNHHRYWRCLHKQRASADRQTVATATPPSNRESSGKEQQPLYGVLRGFFSRSQ